MSKKEINEYYRNLEKAKRFGGTKNEISIKRPFINLLENYFNTKNLYPVDELSLKNSNKRPDGTIRDVNQIDWGHWENKDENDHLEKEIEKKFKIGYPQFNIIFENTIDIILYQNGKKVLFGKMKNADFLDKILLQFVNFVIPEFREFQKAIEDFKKNVPDIILVLREMIENSAKNNKKFIEKRNYFLEICRKNINPDISFFAIQEMIIQHILTDEIFASIFYESYFHRENNIAKELQKVVDTFFFTEKRKNILSKLQNYYVVIKKKSVNISSNYEKQKFLKIIYENFYRAYNPKAADKLGIIYTPNEIVKFMVESTDFLIEKHFNKNLYDKNVEILDPAVGTGTFIAEIINYIPSHYLEYKYKNEIHCNEVAILPYYIANLNIEFSYQEKMGHFVNYENICWMDTLDNVDFFYENKQLNFFEENLLRIKNQNKKKISVIIGNPPYNANQQNENDNNKNKIYKRIDERIKETYVKKSNSQKTKVYDMYSKFYRWSSDRLKDEGIITFITNRSFIDSKTFDGFRKSIKKEFEYIYILDLHGDIRKNPTLDDANVFNILTGVAILFLIKKKKSHTNFIKYFSLNFEKKYEKFDFLKSNNIFEIPFESIIPDKNANWINIVENDFENHIPICNKETKLSKNKKDENAIFKLYSNGILTARDEWVYDFDKKNLKKKIKFFIKEYKSEILGWHKSDKKEKLDNFIHKRNLIKWSRDLKLKLKRKKRIKFDKNLIIKSLYRPFIKKYFYSEKVLNDILTKNHYLFFGENLISDNKIISFVSGSRLDFSAISTNCIPNLTIFSLDPSQNLPFYIYDENDEKKENITNFALEKFKNFYKKNAINKEKIFSYVYGVLHNPVYRKKYEINLKRDFPRIPFYNNFEKWVKFGEKLMNLHLNFEDVKAYNLEIENKNLQNFPNVKLCFNKNKDEIFIDENTKLKNIPKIALEYKLGNRSALEWILDQYKEKKPHDKTIFEKFNNYKFSDYKTEVIDLLKRVCTISVETMKIVNQMKNL